MTEARPRIPVADDDRDLLRLVTLVLEDAFDVLVAAAATLGRAGLRATTHEAVRVLPEPPGLAA